MSKKIRFKAVISKPDADGISTLAIISDIEGGPLAYEFSRTSKEKETCIAQALNIVLMMMGDFEESGRVTFGGIPQESVEADSRLVLSITMVLGEEG